MKKELNNVKHFVVDNDVYATQYIWQDNTCTYVYNVPGEMIHVADCTYEELERRIDADTDDFEAYDLTDGCSYYLSSEYVEEISDALIHTLAALSK